jgi:hypothetical protein
MAKNPGAKNSSGKYLDPAAAIKAGLMQKKTGEFMSPGKVVAKVAAKVAAKSAAKSTAKGLKAAQGPSLAKGAKKIDASSGAYERAIVKMKAQDNMILGDSRKAAYTKASKASDVARAKDIAEAKKILARAKAEKNAASIAKVTKSTKLSKADTKKFTSQIDKDAAKYKAAKKAGK